MTLTKCSCGKMQTTRNSRFLAKRTDFGVRALYFNCINCGSTFVITRLDKKPIQAKEAA